MGIWGGSDQDSPTAAIAVAIVSIQLISPASGNPCIVDPDGVRSPETVSEGQEKKW